MSVDLNRLITEIEALPEKKVYGKVVSIVGSLVEVTGLSSATSVGDRCHIRNDSGQAIPCEVTGFRNNYTLLMPFMDLQGVGLGSFVELTREKPVIMPCNHWLGRVINACGEPVDGKKRLRDGEEAYPIYNRPPPAHTRQRLGGKIDLGIKAMNTFLPCCHGQRMGIFSGSGVGKSTVLSMMARGTNADVIVIGLIGERGREVREFIEDTLGKKGLERACIVVATSDESPLMRRQAAHMTLSIAEYFRDQGRSVLCLMDSVTRFAMALREIGLSTGEPPVNKGYTPSVFSELPRLLERAGPGVEGSGNITGFFTVLVEGDDHNEPISDAVRSILDGHIVLERAIAARGRFPAVDILKSISRTLPDCNTKQENDLINQAKKLVSTYENMEELIRIGAYQKGSEATVDEAIHYFPKIEEFLAQSKDCKIDMKTSYQMLGDVLNIPVPQNPQK